MPSDPPLVIRELTPVYLRSNQPRSRATYMQVGKVNSHRAKELFNKHVHVHCTKRDLLKFHAYNVISYTYYSSTNMKHLTYPQYMQLHQGKYDRKLLSSHTHHFSPQKMCKNLNVSNKLVLSYMYVIQDLHRPNYMYMYVGDAFPKRTHSVFTWQKMIPLLARDYWQTSGVDVQYIFCITVFMLIEHKLKKLQLILTLAQLSGKGRQSLLRCIMKNPRMGIFLR